MKLRIIVHPKSRKPRVEKDADGKFHVYVNQMPEKGKANQAVIEALAEYLQTSKSKISIIAGFKSRRKSIEILR